MGKILKFLTVILILIGLCGCRQDAPNPPPQLITGVYILYRQNGDILERQYTDPQKIDEVLFYLLKLHPYGIADRNPERVAGPTYYIELQLSDGQRHVYRQRADRYLSRDCQAWRLVNPKKAAALYPLLAQLPGD